MTTIARKPVATLQPGDRIETLGVLLTVDNVRDTGRSTHVTLTGGTILMYQRGEHVIAVIAS